MSYRYKYRRLLSMVIVLLVCVAPGCLGGHSQPDRAPRANVTYSRLSFHPTQELIVLDFHSLKFKGIFLMNRQGQVLRWLARPGEKNRWLGDPSFSPDGRSIVFFMAADNNGDKTDLYVMNIDGSGLRRLTNSRFFKFNPRFSSDGKRIYFILHKRLIRSEAAASSSGDIHSLDLATGRVRKLTDLDDLAMDNLFLFPDNRHAIFTMDSTDFERGKHMLWKLDLNDPGKIEPFDFDFSEHAKDPTRQGFTVDVAPEPKHGYKEKMVGRHYRYIDIMEAAMSADGRYIAFSWNNTAKLEWGLYAVDLGDNKVRLLTDFGSKIHPELALHPVGVSNDGREVWFISVPGFSDWGDTVFKPTSLWKIGINGCNLRNLTLDFSAVADSRPPVR